LVEKLEGQAQQLPGRIPNSPIAFSPMASTGHQGCRLGGPNLHGRFGEINGLGFELESGMLIRLGEINSRGGNFRGDKFGGNSLGMGLFKPGGRVVDHLGFHFRIKSEIARLILSHWFLIALLVLDGLFVLTGLLVWIEPVVLIAGFVFQGITRRRPMEVIDRKSNGG
jgi:hypothetical protein